MYDEMTLHQGAGVCRRKILSPLFTSVALIGASLITGTMAGRLPPLLTVVAAAGVLVGLLTLLRPDWAFDLFFAGIVLLTDSAPETGSCFFISDADLFKGLPSMLTTFFLLLLCVTVVRRIVMERTAIPISLRGLGIYLLILLIATLTGLLHGGDRELIYFDFMKMLIPVLCFYVCMLFLATPERLYHLLAILLVVSAGKALILSAAYLAGNGWEYQLDDTAAYQVTTMDSADLLAFITLLLTAGYLLVRRSIQGGRAVWVGAACLPMLFVVIFSYRRAQWAGLVFSMGLLFLGASRNVRKRLVILFMAVLCIGSAAAVVSGISEEKVLRIASRITSVFDSDQSSNLFHRLEAQRVMLDIAASPLVGLGLGTNHSPVGQGMDESDSVPRNVVHNTFLYIWMKLGLPGFLFFMWAAVHYARRILHVRRDGPPEVFQGLLLPLTASSGLWLTMFLTAPVPWYIHTTVLIALFAAMGLSLIQQAEQRHDIFRSPPHESLIGQ